MCSVEIYIFLFYLLYSLQNYYFKITDHRETGGEECGRRGGELTLGAREKNQVSSRRVIRRDSARERGEIGGETLRPHSIRHCIPISSPLIILRWGLSIL